MSGCDEVVEAERVRALLNCSTPHLYYVSSSVRMSCSHVWSGVGPLVVVGWRAIAPPTSLRRRLYGVNTIMR